jgi:uncharacterized protein YecT (DUF1311 family)
VRALAVCLAVLGAPGAAAAQAWDCADIGSLPQQGINYCLGQDYAAWDTELNRVYQLVIAQLGPADEETLRVGQRAWITYRDNACDVEASAMRGGSGEAMLRFACLARLTERRAQDLANFAAIDG